MGIIAPLFRLAWEKQPGPAWLLTSYESPASATRVSVREALAKGSGPTPLGTEAHDTSIPSVERNARSASMEVPEGFTIESEPATIEPTMSETLPAPTLKNLHIIPLEGMERKIPKHWLQNQPKMVAQLAAKGTLYPILERLSEQVAEIISDYLGQKVPLTQAQELRADMCMVVPQSALSEPSTQATSPAPRPAETTASLRTLGSATEHPAKS